jgi:hypothetical protein
MPTMPSNRNFIYFADGSSLIKTTVAVGKVSEERIFSVV